MKLEIENTTAGDRVIVTPHGEIDLVSQALLKEHLIDLIVGGHVHLVVDLSETTFLDSTGLGTLVGARRRLHTVEGSLVLVCPHERMLKLFRITGLDKYFAIHPTRAAATGDGAAPAQALPTGLPG